MSEIKALLKLELRSFYGINQMLNTRDSKLKKRFKTVIASIIILIVMAVAYISALVTGLCSIGLSEIVPMYLVVISSLIIAFFGIFTAGNRIFSKKGYDVLVSLPINKSSVAVSRFLGHYIADLLLAVLIMAVGLVSYGRIVKPSISFYLFAAVITVFIPAIPLAAATLLGTAVSFIASKMKRKSLANSFLSVLIVVGVIVASFSMESLTEGISKAQLQSLAGTVGNAFKRIYPLSTLASSAINEGNILGLVFFVLLSVAVTLLVLLLVCKNFSYIVSSLSNVNAKHNYKMGKMESRSALKTLYVREAKRYFASSIYVTNTIIGPVLGTIMAVAVAVSGLDSLREIFPSEINIVGVLPFVFSAIFCMMPTTSVAISMEGRQFWVVKSLPVPIKTLLDSKILFNLSLMLPFFAVSEIALAIAVRPSALELLWMLLIPACMVLFAAVLGITVNLRFNSFDWEREETVVKQSLASALGGFAGLFVSFLLGVISLLLPQNFVKLVIFLVLIALTALLYKSNNKKKLEEL